MSDTGKDKITVRISKGIIGQLDDFVSYSDKFKTRSDFIRHLIKKEGMKATMFRSSHMTLHQKTFEEIRSNPEISDDNGRDYEIKMIPIPIEKELQKYDESLYNFMDVDSEENLRVIEEIILKNPLLKKCQKENHFSKFSAANQQPCLQT